VRLTSAALAASLIASCLCAQSGGGDDGAATRKATLYVFVSRAWLSPLDAVSDCWLVVENGVLRAIAPQGTFRPPEGSDVVELPEGWALPTFVHAAAEDLCDGEDAESGTTPDAVAADAFDPFLPRPKYAAAGVARAYVSIGRARLVPGAGSLVRTLGAEPTAAIVRRRAALRLDFREDVKSTPDIWEPPDVPTAEDPLPPSRLQGPRTRGGALAKARALFAAAAALPGTPGPPAYGDVDLRPFRVALEKATPVRVAADRRADIEAAIALAREFGLRLIVEGATEAHSVAAELKAVGASVVLRLVARPPYPADASEPIFLPGGRGSIDAPSVLKAAGVPLALVPPEGSEPSELWFHATRALRLDGSFAADDVLASTTWGAAEIVGFPDPKARATGALAEFAVFAGSPFETTARPALVVSGGRVAHRATPKPDVVAIFASRVHTCEGDALRDAVVLVEGGKIRSVGRYVSIPPDARRVRAEVVVPGFVAAACQTGVRAYVHSDDEVVTLAPPIAGALDQPLSKWFDARVADARAAAEAGVTTLALAPTTGRLVSGVVSTVKSTGAFGDEVNRASAVVFDVGVAPAGDGLRKQIESALEPGRRYHEAWLSYEKARKEWEKGGGSKSASADRKTLTQPSAPKSKDPVSGTWEGALSTSGFPRPIPFTLKLTLSGSAVSGTITSPIMRGQERSVSGSYADGVLTADTEEQGLRLTVKANVGRDVMTGTAHADGLGDGTFEARRTEKPADSDAEKAESRPKDGDKGADSKTAESRPADDGAPKPPKRDEGLEALRALFRDEAAAYVRAPTSAHAEIALAVFRGKYDLRTVIASSADLAYMAEKYKAAGVAFAATETSARDHRGRTFSPAATALRAGLPTLYRGEVGDDPRGLYAAAERAVRDGADRDDALRLVTRRPAQYLGLLSRVGSLATGKDADLVILSGDVFEAGTRVLRTMIDGKFVDEARKP
jgi:imidazolonepropionase-like amidohydrolase